MEWICSHCQMNVRHCCQMAQLVSEEMRFELGWNSTSTTISKSENDLYKKVCCRKILNLVEIVQ